MSEKENEINVSDDQLQTLYELKKGIDEVNNKIKIRSKIKGDDKIGRI